MRRLDRAFFWIIYIYSLSLFNIYIQYVYLLERLERLNVLS